MEANPYAYAPCTMFNGQALGNAANSATDGPPSVSIASRAAEKEHHGAINHLTTTHAGHQRSCSLFSPVVNMDESIGSEQDESLVAVKMLTPDEPCWQCCT